MGLTIREYRPADFDALWSIDQACFLPGISYTRFELKTYMGRPGAFTLVAVAEAGRHRTAHAGSDEVSPGEDPNGIVGFVVAERSRRAGGHIITIDVHPEVRRQQIGSLLLASAEQRLRLSACSTIQLEAAVDNAAALSFYKRQGYNVSKTIPRYYANGVDALVLEKKLLSPFPSR